VRILRRMSSQPATRAESEQIPYLGGPWFLAPDFEREIERRGLDPDDEAKVRFFAERGYVILDDLGIEDFDAFADGIEADLEPLHAGKYNRIMDAWTVSDRVRRLATSPRILGFLEVLYGRRPIPFQTLNFLRGSQQHAHSDAYHFHSYPKHFMCGVWVALEDTDDDNGTLSWYPGSHRLPDYDFLCPSREEVLHEYLDELIPQLGLQKELGYLKRGQALIWAANLLHGGEPQLDYERTRRSQVTHCYFDDCSYYTPFRSDFARGKVFFRQITDVTTGKPHTLRISTGRVRPPLAARVVTWQRRLGRALGRGYVRY
jgi:Phytanoyl-CoA dioxygenase (PhyH)